MPSLDTPLSQISLIKAPFLAKLERLGIFTVRDLLYHFPHRYEDFSAVRSLASLEEGEKCTVEGEVKDVRAGKSFRKRMLVTEAVLSDESGSLRVVWFNQRFIQNTVKPGTRVRLSGKVTRDAGGLVMTNPETERSGRDATHTARLVPIYPETRGLTSRFFRWQITELLQKLPRIPDPIPEDVLARLHLPTLRSALVALHAPKTNEQVQVAEKRFAFEEMLTLQLKTQEIKALYEGSRALPLRASQSDLRIFFQNLPFELTASQKEAADAIAKDLSGERPMNRLLNGDVGSGKTVVAALALYTAALSGAQSVLLAPTEVLARQHYETLGKLLKWSPFAPTLFTGSFRLLDGRQVTRRTMLEAIRAGIPRILIGTHALIQSDVAFERLALVIIDEQHRFGVAQRSALQERTVHAADGSEERVPHFLTMTATPIPRTLTLTLFGSLDLSLLTEMPKDRLPIETEVVAPADRARVYRFIDSEIAAGRQAFIIFPLVEESMQLRDVKAAVAEHERLAHEIFPDRRIGLIHGKMKAADKEAVMQAFQARQFDILVATAVVEVGIDVPNASVIMIEEAERFGLSQLHQFRGRVGRGAHQSYCFLMPGKDSASENARLRTLAENANGFAIAEADLALRGPGAFLGTRQSGLPDIAMEHLTNLRLIEIAQKEAEDLLAADPDLAAHPRLRELLERFAAKVHLE